jgi:hypothetical protein
MSWVEKMRGQMWIKQMVYRPDSTSNLASFHEAFELECASVLFSRSALCYVRSLEAHGFCTPAQCPREGCDGSQAFFYQVQIRSADEPMTTFYKV